MDELVGRAVETALIDAGTDSLPDVGGSLVLLGDAGIGKTALASAACARAAAAGRQVISVTASEVEDSLPFAALQQVLQSLSRGGGSIQPRAKEVLDRALGIDRAGSTDVFAVGVAVLEALSDLVGTAGLVLHIDDVHWLDDSTAQVLAFVARRIVDDPVFLLLSMRSGNRSPLLASGIPALTVASLSIEAAETLLGARRPELSVRERKRIIDAAAGNPLGLLELPRDFDSSTERSLDARLTTTFTSRLRRVAPDTRTLLLAAALNDGDAVEELSAVGGAMGLAEEVVTTALRESLASGVIQIVSGRVRFGHPLVRSAIVSESDEPARRVAHSALSHVLERDPARALWHRAAAASGPDDEIACDLEMAAERAATQGNIAIAFRSWSRAIELSSGGLDQARRRVRAADAALELGRTETAVGILDAIDASVLPSADAVRCTLIRLAVDPHAASPRELTGLLAQAAHLLGAGDIGSAVEIAVTVGEHVDAGGLPAQADLARLGKRIVSALPNDDPRRLAVLAASDPVGNSAEVSRAILELDPAELDERAELLVRIRFNVDADPVLARMQRRLLDSYRQRGRLRSIVFLQPGHTWNEICLADWPEALRAAEEGTRLGQELGFPRWATGTLIGLGHIAALRGDHRGAARYIWESEQGATRAGAHNVLTGVQLTKGTNYLAQRRLDESFAAFRRTHDPHDPSFHPIQSTWSLGDLAEVAAGLGRTAEVAPLVERGAAGPPSPWQALALAYAAPFLAQNDDLTEEAFANALNGVVGRWPTYRVRMQVEFGAWLRRRRRLQEARERLFGARDDADALLMNPWSDRARLELRALGFESPPHTASAWEKLSAQELEVAQLAAQGFSNREIGERLFLSHRTVSSHLYRVFPKLGVTNRAQLAGALRAQAITRS